MEVTYFSSLSLSLSLYVCVWHVHMVSVEGVFCRIKQKLDKYRLEPVASLIDDRISNSRVSYEVCE